MHDARARFFVRRIAAVPVALLAPLVAVPHAAAQLASPASVGPATRDARAKFHELLGDGSVVRQLCPANFGNFEHLLGQPKVLLESAPSVEEATREIIKFTTRIVVGKRSRDVALHSLVGHLQPGEFHAIEKRFFLRRGRS